MQAKLKFCEAKKIELTKINMRHLAGNSIKFLNAQNVAVKDFFISLAKQIAFLPWKDNKLFKVCFDELFGDLETELISQCYKFQSYNKLYVDCHDEHAEGVWILNEAELDRHVLHHQSWHETENLGTYPTTVAEEDDNKLLAEAANKTADIQYNEKLSDYQKEICAFKLKKHQADKDGDEEDDSSDDTTEGCVDAFILQLFLLLTIFL